MDVNSCIYLGVRIHHPACATTKIKQWLLKRRKSDSLPSYIFTSPEGVI